MSVASSPAPDRPVAERPPPYRPIDIRVGNWRERGPWISCLVHGLTWDGRRLMTVAALSTRAVHSQPSNVTTEIVSLVLNDAIRELAHRG